VLDASLNSASVSRFRDPIGRLPLAYGQFMARAAFRRVRKARVTWPPRKSTLTLAVFAVPLLVLVLLFSSPPLFAESPNSQASGVPPSSSEEQDSPDIKPIPVLQTSAGFITTFDGGEPHLGPVITPVLLVPIGQRWLFETRATFESDLTQQPAMTGFHGTVEKEVEYAQLDFIASQYMTVTVGRFLTPFGIYNERLYPVWIRNLATDPLTLPIGVGPSNASTGAMVRGGFQANASFNINYVVYYSALSTITPVDSSRLAGGRAGVFVPKARLEIGGSFQHLLQDDHSNLYGFHLIWQPRALPLDIRAETARSSTGSGYWLEAAYRLNQLPFARNELRRAQVVARMQQFYTGVTPGNSVLPVNTNMFEFGVNYYFRDDFRAISSYGRQFSPQGNANVWTIGLTYRLVMPLGRGEVP
jgi:hypothetical protein